ncbi:MAG TPA: phenylalanine--tRNA ligase subunit beta [Nevskiaceae bacterium]|nr:phenylalanine--tRNA ligase subunit beta [Nevskiaceae bacterium]
MKLSESWLREWVNPGADIHEIAERLVMGGLELDIEPALAERPSGVVVGRIVHLEPHPNAERLRVCEVEVGQGGLRRIVCGAPNARAGLLVPCALPGAQLPGGLSIGVSTLRGVESAGMLCSAAELGLSGGSDGLLELDADARPGQPIEAHLKLDDRILNLELTPNRGDCLSVHGLAREIAALYGIQAARPRIRPAVVVGEYRFTVELEDPLDCPNYAGRVIVGVKPKVRTPDWMRERLRRSGIRSIHPVVDITAYVMLELGQPLHAFDATRLAGVVRVRRAREGEGMRLLNGEFVHLRHRELLVTDERGPAALAGVMGGADSAVSEASTRIFLESACFAPTAVAGTARRHKLFSDAAYRFERGVDPELQRQALERATELVIQICGGEAGPITHVGRTLPEPIKVPLRLARVRQLLGHEISAREVEQLLSRLGVVLSHADTGTWHARVPSCRYDLRIEADLIEEVARLYGYDRIPAKSNPAQIAPSRPPEGQRSLDAARDRLIARGYQEVINLAFADPAPQALLDGGAMAVALDNPLAENAAVMRSTLWGGLIQSWQYNRSRQSARIRLFECGVCFHRDSAGGAIVETSRVAGLISGSALPEQWGSRPPRAADFYDLKGDVEALLGPGDWRFEAAGHPALHPGQSARIYRGEQPVGWLGALHPQRVTQLDLPSTPLLFELDWTVVRAQPVPRVQALSEFPSSRRDLALKVPEAVTAQALERTLRRAAGPSLQELVVFDVYRGSNLSEGFKSVAMGLIFQDYSRTLTLEEVDACMLRITAELERELGAVVR